jgi:O-antigen ligase
MSLAAPGPVLAAGPRPIPDVVRSTLASALTVGLALLLTPLVARPRVLAAAAGAMAFVALATWTVRRHGPLGAWLAALTVSILAGEMSALPLGGQSGRLLWVDGVLALGVAIAALRGGLTLTVPRAPFLDRQLLLLGWSALTLVTARDPLTGIAEWKEWAVAWAAGAAALTFARDASRARMLLGVVAVTGALVALAMTWVAFHSALGPVLAVLLKQVDLPWGRTNYLAGLLVLALPVALGLMGHAASRRERLAWLSVTLVNVVGIALSASKGAVVALVVGLGVAFVWGGRGTRATALALLVVMAAVVMVFTVGPLHEVVAYRLQSSALDYSVGERMELYRLAVDTFARQPLLGVGLNNFSVVSNRLTGVDTVPHNLELGFLAELGLPGLLMVLAWVLALGHSAWRARAATAPRDRALGVGLWAAFLAFVVHNQFESTIYGQQYKLLLVVVAAATWRLGECAHDVRCGSHGSQQGTRD